jgi:hypothetical protein
MPALPQGPLPSAPSSKRRPMIRSAAGGFLDASLALDSLLFCHRRAGLIR